MATLPYLLWLTDREGLRPETAAALLRRFGTAEAVYFADEKEFELLQLPGRLCRSLADKSLAELRPLARQHRYHPERPGLWQLLPAAGRLE